MKTIPIPILNIYEFQCENSLAEKFHNDAFSCDINFSRIRRKDLDRGNPASVGFFNVENENYFFSPEWFNWTHECLQKVAEIHGLPTLKICDYWITKSKFGETSHRHDHACSILSGLYYFTDQTDSSTIFVHDYVVSNHYSFLTTKIIPPLLHQVKPEKGKLIIFPSFLKHEFVMKDKNTRYTFAFNSFIDGLVSKKDTGKLKLNVLQPPITPAERNI